MIEPLFLKHPRSVDESYLQHMLFAARFAGWLALAAFAAFAHAVLPCLFEKTASTIVKRLNDQIASR